MKKMFAIGILAMAALGGIGTAFLATRESNEQETNKEAPASAAKETTYIATFTLNVQDFSYPEKSAAVLEKLITAHEEKEIPVEVFLTTTMIDIFSEEYPELWSHLTTSSMVDISYHIRPPVPYHNVAAETINWDSMSNEEIYNLVYTYETHGLDLANGAPTEEPGSFAKLTSLLSGKPARCVGAAAGPETAEIVHEVFRDLGAACLVDNSLVTNLGEYRSGLWVRPQHVDIKFFEESTKDPQEIIAAAMESAKNAEGAEAPYFLNIKMHDNDFFAENSAWTTVFLAPGARRNGPPYDTSLASNLLSEDEQNRMLAAYIELLNTVKNTTDLTIMNLEGVASLLKD